MKKTKVTGRVSSSSRVSSTDSSPSTAKTNKGSSERLFSGRTKSKVRRVTNLRSSAYQYRCLSVCLSITLKSTRVSVDPFIYLYLSISLYRSAIMYISRSIILSISFIYRVLSSIFPNTYLFIYLFIHVSICISTRASILSCVYLPQYLSIPFCLSLCFC